MGTVYSLPSYYSLIQPPKESETLRKAIVKIHNLADYDRDTLYLRSSAAVVYSLFVSFISTLDAVSYFVRIPVQFTNSIVACEFKTAFLGIGHNVANTANSLKLSILLVISAVGGIFIPYHAFNLLPDTRPAQQIAEEALAEIERQIAAKQKELDATVRSTESHQTIKLRSQQLEQERVGLEERLVQTRSEHERLNSACTDLARKKADLERATSGEAIEELQRQVRTTEERRNTLGIEIGALEGQQRLLTLAIEQLRTESERLTREKGTAEEQLEGVSARLREESAKLDRLTQKNGQAELAGQRIQEQLEQTQATIAELEQQKQRLTGNVEGLQRTSEDLTRENSSAHEQLRAVLAQLEKERDKLRLLTEDQQRIERETGPAKELLARIRGSTQELGQEKDRLELALQTLRQESERLTHENGLTQGRLEAIHVQLREQQEKLDTAIAAEKQRIAEATRHDQQELERLRQEIQVLNEQGAELKRQAEASRKELEQLEQARAAIVVDREEVARLKAYLEENGPQRRDLEARLEALRKECEAEEKKKRKIEARALEIQKQIQETKPALAEVQKSKDGFVRELKAAAARITLLHQGISEKIRELEAAIRASTLELEGVDRSTHREQAEQLDARIRFLQGYVQDLSTIKLSDTSGLK
jgi:chromosome segregation ATPase